MVYNIKEVKKISNILRIYKDLYDLNPDHIKIMNKISKIYYKHFDVDQSFKFSVFKQIPNKTVVCALEFNFKQYVYNTYYHTILHVGIDENNILIVNDFDYPEEQIYCQRMFLYVEDLFNYIDEVMLNFIDTRYE